MVKQSKRGIGKLEVSFILISISILLLDQITKRIIAVYVTKPIFLVDQFVYISFTKNTGISFGLFQKTGIFPSLIALIIIVGLLYYYPKIPKKKPYQFLTAGILGGAVGNLIDRIAYGYVIDFMNLWKWPAFNVADAAITIGALGLIYLLWKEK